MSEAVISSGKEHMILSGNGFSLWKYLSFAVPTTVTSNLREVHLGLRFARKSGLGYLIFRCWTLYSANGSLSRMCQGRPSGKKAHIVYNPFPHFYFQYQYQNEGSDFYLFHPHDKGWIFQKQLVTLKITLWCSAPYLNSKPLKRNAFHPSKHGGTQCC